MRYFELFENQKKYLPFKLIQLIIDLQNHRKISNKDIEYLRKLPNDFRKSRMAWRLIAMSVLEFQSLLQKPYDWASISSWSSEEYAKHFAVNINEPKKVFILLQRHFSENEIIIDIGTLQDTNLFQESLKYYREKGEEDERYELRWGEFDELFQEEEIVVVPITIEKEMICAIMDPTTFNKYPSVWVEPSNENIQNILRLFQGIK